MLLSYETQSQNGSATFTNPLLPSGADPFSFYKDGYYYYTHTLGNSVGIWKAKSIAGLKNAEYKIIYTPPAGTMYSKDVWAPEILFINNKWYAYFAADDGRNENHRMYVLENESADPMKGEWIFKGKVADPSDKWAIDGDVFQYNNEWYLGRDASPCPSWRRRNRIRARWCGRPLRARRKTQTSLRSL